MPSPLAELLERARAWFATAHEAGWLDDDDLQRLNAVEQGTPADLFTDEQRRPLVVAFFGGTGVGKSSLLNRLAGETIARTGVERPTSREVTVYVHNAVQLAELPPDLPVETVQIKRHGSDAQREVLWIDAPDIDSVEEANRRNALAWLPHVDLVCYVVSPERYRDDVGWQVLRRRGHKHGWLFVMNRSDEGDPQQVDDFARMLREAGFENPLLLSTSCAADRTPAARDDFDQLREILRELQAAHGVRELTRLGHRARVQELRGAIQAAARRFGNEATWEQLAGQAHAGWDATAATLRDGAAYSMQAIAGRFASDADTVWEQLRQHVLSRRSKKRGDEATDPEATDIVLLNELTGQLWDDWTQSKLRACLDAAEVSARRSDLAVVPLRRRLDEVADAAGDRITQTLRDHVRAALARPGNALTRALRRGTGFLMAFLPLIAMAWVGWKVVQGFYHAVSPADFLGVNFAVNSLLLVAIAWALPYLLDRMLRPSMERTVLRALQAGLDDGLADVGQQLAEAFGAAARDAQQYRERARQLLNEAGSLVVRPVDARVPTLGRVIKSHSETAAS